MFATPKRDALGREAREAKTFFASAAILPNFLGSEEKSARGSRFLSCPDAWVNFWRFVSEDFGGILWLVWVRMIWISAFWLIFMIIAWFWIILVRFCGFRVIDVFLWRFELIFGGIFWFSGGFFVILKNFWIEFYLEHIICNLILYFAFPVDFWKIILIQETWAMISSDFDYNLE